MRQILLKFSFIDHNTLVICIPQLVDGYSNPPTICWSILILFSQISATIIMYSFHHPIDKEVMPKMNDSCSTQPSAVASLLIVE
jgi:hypothetical protein